MKIFVSCNLDFEKILIEEMKYFWPFLLGTNGAPHQEVFPECQMLPGGIEFEGTLHQAVQLNFFLKTANRVLVRVHQFRARDFPRLFEGIQKINWSQWIDSIPTEILVEASQSRLNHEKRILQTLEDAFAQIKSLKPSDHERTPRLFVRIHEDVATLSFDLSGEHLHKRGYGVFKGEAPLRETLAAGLLRLCLSHINAQVDTIWDPFCGSGTFLLEAQMLENGPLIRKFDFRYLKNSPKLFKTELWAKNYRIPVRAAFTKYLGSDLNHQVLDLAKKNHQLFTEIYPVIAQKIQWEIRDFQSSPDQVLQTPTLVIMNPPYGERLAGFTKSWQILLEELAQKEPKVLFIGTLLPRASVANSVKGFQKVLSHRFKTGGLPVQFDLWGRL